MIGSTHFANNINIVPRDWNRIGGWLRVSLQFLESMLSWSKCFLDKSCRRIAKAMESGGGWNANYQIEITLQIDNACLSVEPFILSWLLCVSIIKSQSRYCNMLTRGGVLHLTWHRYLWQVVDFSQTMRNQLQQHPMIDFGKHFNIVSELPSTKIIIEDNRTALSIYKKHKNI